MAEGECPKNRKYKTHFTPDYTKVYPCLIRVKHNDSLARCTVCNSDFSIAHGGLNDCKRYVEEQYLNECFDQDECSDLQKSKVEQCRTAVNSVLNELFEEKISTQQAHHWILGPEDLEETLVYVFDAEAE